MFQLLRQCGAFKYRWFQIDSQPLHLLPYNPAMLRSISKLDEVSFHMSGTEVGRWCKLDPGLKAPGFKL